MSTNINIVPKPENWLGNHLVSIEEIDGKRAVRIEAHVHGQDVNCMREANNTPRSYSVKPGDKIVFRAWIKTGASTVGRNGMPFNGAMIGMDWWNWTSGYISGARPDESTLAYGNWVYDNLFVPMNSNWTLREIHYTVPAEMYGIVPESFILWLSAGFPSHVYNWTIGPNGDHVNDDTKQPVNVPEQEQGLCWFANIECYINPSALPTVYTCPTCQAQFSSQAELDQHIATVHPPPPPPTYQEWIVTRTEPQPTQEWKITVTSPPKVSGWV